MVEHYYGDTVRRLFMASGMIMLVGLPFIYDNLPLPLFSSLLAISVVALTAGFLSPIHFPVLAFDLSISVGGLIAFEYYAVQAYLADEDAFFALNQALAIIFFYALYYSVKTLRGASPNIKDMESQHDSPAVHILKMRYASGDIKQREFEEKMKELEDHHEKQSVLEEAGGFDSSGDG
ncbi:MAG: hypothetical protein AAB495_00380 [Patescibacteria group bacterium]